MIIAYFDLSFSFICTPSPPPPPVLNNSFYPYFNDFEQVLIFLKVAHVAQLHKFSGIVAMSTILSVYIIVRAVV